MAITAGSNGSVLQSAAVLFQLGSGDQRVVEEVVRGHEHHESEPEFGGLARPLAENQEKKAPEGGAVI